MLHYLVQNIFSAENVKNELFSSIQPAFASAVKYHRSYLDDQGPISETASWGGISMRDLIASRSLIR